MNRTTLVLASWSFLAAAGAASAAPPSLTFNGTGFLHRWSSKGQHEFTPRGEEDLAAWTSMVTIVVHDGVRDGEQLAGLANTVLGHYGARGKVLRTDSRPRTKDGEAEHFIAAVLGDPAFLEAGFARVRMSEGRGVVIVYSRRVYGAGVGDAMSAWLRANGEKLERALMTWTGLPALAVLRAAPESKPAAPARQRP